jgi:PhnB protein
MPKKSAKKKAPKTNSKKAPRAQAAAKKSGKKKKASATRVAARSKKVEAVPSQYGTASPHLIVSPCGDALEFYEKAFGAKVKFKMPGPGGMIMHAEIKIGDSIVMFSDEMPPMPGQPANRKSPRNAGATTGGVMLYVKDVDALVERAVGAGATTTMPPQDMFWGDRYAQLEDPFGHVWAVATHQRDVSMKEMRQGMAQMGTPEA